MKFKYLNYLIPGWNIIYFFLEERRRNLHYQEDIKHINFLNREIDKTVLQGDISKARKYRDELVDIIGSYDKSYKGIAEIIVEARISGLEHVLMNLNEDQAVLRGLILSIDKVKIVLDKQKAQDNRKKIDLLLKRYKATHPKIISEFQSFLDEDRWYD